MQFIPPTIRVARKKYYDDKFKEYSKDCKKKTLQTINSVLGRGWKSINIPDTFVNNGLVLSGEAEISEGFKTFFSSIGPKLAKNIPNSTKKILITLKKLMKTLFLQI